ncbi:MAG: Ig-like domain-containing protein [Anaerolineae bacterium]
MGDANWVASDAFGGPVNLAPTADAQAVSLAEDDALAIALTGADPEEQPLTFLLLSQPAHGTLSGDAPNLIYTPVADYHGPDSFTFQVNDGQLSSPAAAVAITVTPVNDAPVANDDLATTLQDTPAVIAVLANDSDVDGDSLGVSGLSLAANGLVSSDGISVTYTPNIGYFGSDAFTYAISDGNGGSAAAQVTVTVQWVNAPPVAQADSAVTAEDQALVVGVLANDFDADGHALQIIAAGGAAHGAVQHDGSLVTYTPAADFHGSDAFSYTISDGYGGESTAQVQVTVTPVNDNPTALPDSAATAIDTAITIDVLANDGDVDGDALSVSALSQPAHGAASSDGVTVIYTPSAGYFGSDAFSYTLSDGNGGSATALVTVTVSGNAGYALNFDGVDDQAMLGQTGPMLGAGWESNKTVELWVKPTGDALSGPSPAHLDLVFGDRPRWWGISRGVQQGQDRIWVWNYDGNYDMIAVEYSAGQWTHIALVHSGGLLHAYKDGVLVGSVPSGATQQPSTGAQPTLYFGGMIISAARNYTMSGEIDELRLWNTGLDAATLQTWRNQELGAAHPALASLRAYYRMANGVGAAVGDDSGHGFTGALLGSMGDANWTSSGAFAN